MPRPKKPRFVSGYPTLTAFVPQGVPISGEVQLSIEELEAVRLSDFEGLDQEAAANLMRYLVKPTVEFSPRHATLYPKR
jgi:predicted DNA-binding protein (UPF0251 family)